MTSDRAFVHSLRIDAPPEAVFACFADPASLADWWGPDGFSCRFDAFEFRSGGAWRFVMHGPEGRQYPMLLQFREVVPHERVVIEQPKEDHHFVLTIRLEPIGPDATMVHWRQVFDTAEEHDRVASVVAPSNEQNLRRLAAAVRRRADRDASGAAR